MLAAVIYDLAGKEGEKEAALEKTYKTQRDVDDFMREYTAKKAAGLDVKAWGLQEQARWAKAAAVKTSKPRTAALASKKRKQAGGEEDRDDDLVETEDEGEERVALYQSIARQKSGEDGESLLINWPNTPPTKLIPTSGCEVI